MAYLRTLLSAALALAMSAGAQAGPGEDCNQRADPDLTIRGCTAIIEGQVQVQEPAVAYVNRAVAFASKGDRNRAIADLDEAVRLSPRSTLARVNRGILLSGRGDIDAAMADFDETIRIDPQSAIAYRNRGNLWLGKRQTVRAIEDYNEAVRLDPKSVIGLVNRGHAWLAADSPEAAIPDFSRAIMLAPTDRGVYMLRGRAYFVRGTLDAASDDFRQAAALGDPYGALWRYFLTVRLKRDGRDELDRFAAGLPGPQWPTPLFQFFQNKLTGTQLRALPRHPNAICDVDFYEAQWHLGRGNADLARPLLQNAAAGCPAQSIERAGAVAELARLGGTGQAPPR